MRRAAVLLAALGLLAGCGADGAPAPALGGVGIAGQRIGVVGGV